MVATGMVEVMLEHMMLEVAILEHMTLEHMVLGLAMPPKIQVMEHLIHNDIIRFVDMLMMVVIVQRARVTTIRLDVTNTYIVYGHHHPVQYQYRSCMGMDNHLLNPHMYTRILHPIRHMDNHFMVSQTWIHMLLQPSGCVTFPSSLNICLLFIII
jgi:hypothetical protein